jgi:hypothetical protein
MQRIYWTEAEQSALIAQISTLKRKPKSCAVALARAQVDVLPPERQRKWLCDRKIDEGLLIRVRVAIAALGTPVTPPFKVRDPVAPAPKVPATQATTLPSSTDAMRLAALEHTLLELVDSVAKIDAALSELRRGCSVPAPIPVVTPPPPWSHLAPRTPIEVIIIGCPNNGEIERIRRRLQAHTQIEFNLKNVDSDSKPRPVHANVVIVHASVCHAWWDHLVKTNGADRCLYLPRGGTTLTYEKILDMARKQIALQSKIDA